MDWCKQTVYTQDFTVTLSEDEITEGAESLNVFQHPQTATVHCNWRFRTAIITIGDT